MFWIVGQVDSRLVVKFERRRLSQVHAELAKKDGKVYRLFRGLGARHDFSLA